MNIVYTTVISIISIRSMPFREQDEQHFSLLEIIGKIVQRLIGKKSRSPCYLFLTGEQQIIPKLLVTSIYTMQGGF